MSYTHGQSTQGVNTVSGGAGNIPPPVTPELERAADRIFGAAEYASALVGRLQGVVFRLSGRSPPVTPSLDGKVQAAGVISKFDDGTSRLQACLDELADAITHMNTLV